MKFLLSLFIIITTLSSCDSSKKAMAKQQQIKEALSETYQITQVGNNNLNDSKLIISFDKTSNKVNGFGGCNSFFGSYAIEGNQISFEGIGASKKLCQKEISGLENHFLKSLRIVNTVSIEDNTISFLEDDTVLIKGITTTTSSKKNNKVAASNETAVKYQASSRNTFDFVLVSESRVVVSKDKGLLKTSTYQVDVEDWNTISELIKAIDVETLQDVKAPSTAHQYDGAAHATLVIIIGDVEYMTPAFDHGNPPETIEALVNKVLSIKENLVKP